jgi:hypothetical protein
MVVICHFCLIPFVISRVELQIFGGKRNKKIMFLFNRHGLSRFCALATMEYETSPTGDVSVGVP